MTNVVCHCCWHIYPIPVGSFTFLSALASLMSFVEYHHYEMPQNCSIYICATQSATHHKAKQNFVNCYLLFFVGRVALSVQQLATTWTVWGSNPGGDETFRTCPDLPWGPPSLLYNGYRVYPGGKERPGVTLTPHQLLVLWSRKRRTIPVRPLWAVRPLVSLCQLPSFGARQRSLV